ncbi:hypothetical protein BD311DRAFT_10088 [Dichomitus squalens]|uniref:Uncharacterized protein n=1 Tax=Dichomitus squalens TaxID=114155 RepID=A0A4Q9N6H3_9APHY|nr:hypothetical protein BD311DRAFT_10088 [Dichomitus squalens]
MVIRPRRRQVPCRKQLGGPASALVFVSEIWGNPITSCNQTTSSASSTRARGPHRCASSSKPSEDLFVSSSWILRATPRIQ